MNLRNTSLRVKGDGGRDSSRLVIGPPLVWKTLACPYNDYIVKAGGFGILAMSAMWGMSIVKEVKKLTGGGKAKQA